HQQNHLAVEKKKEAKDYEIIEVKSITSFPLIEYLNSRKISVELAQKYCREIHYKMKGRTYYAIGFPTEFGYEIRNKYVKICLNGKGLSWFKKEKEKLKLFESWSDFLSYLTLFPQDENQFDFLVLNSISLLRKKLNEIKIYDQIHCYFDRDKAGRNAFRFLKNNSINEIIDKSNLYENFNDLNDYLVNENK